MSDLLKIMEDAADKMRGLGQAMETTLTSIERIQQIWLKAHGPKAELIFRLNERWQYNREPGKPFNWRGLQ